MVSNLQKYFCNSDHTKLYAIINVFFWGLILSPLNNGIIISFLYLVITESIRAYLNYNYKNRFEYFFLRLICITVYLIAFLLGKFITKREDILLGFPIEISYV